MNRITITIDEDLLGALDQYMAMGGTEIQSEAVRDLLRAGLLKSHEAETDSRPCVSALIYVYDHGNKTTFTETCSRPSPQFGDVCL
jgi:CopG family nickel-responsive transcriptional regulator